uniref:Uncharacterized protein n=1 Tax=Rhizophora mucronata TaxID=61149 RepID=A0A2P2K5B2_RHIMU
MAATKAIVSQVSCFSSLSRNRRSILWKHSYPKFSVVMSLGNDISSSEIKTSLTAGDQCPFHNPAAEEVVKKENVISDDPVKNAYGAAKLHDFCLGIPYGGFIITGGLVGFIFSRNIATLSTTLFGGALLFLGTLSLKNWRQGNSSLPFVLGQAGN